MKSMPQIVTWLILISGCAAEPKVNPSFSVTREEARAAIAAMRDDPKPLARPLVILGGFSDPISAHVLRERIERAFNDERIIAVTFATCTDFEQCRRRVLAAVDERFGAGDDAGTIEVDVIGISMGGLVARVSAEPDDPDARRLRIARLFTIASPLQGAKLADFPLALTPLHRDMREGSELLNRLNANAPPYTIIAYTRLHDRTVGEALAAPPGQEPRWLDTPRFGIVHGGTVMDQRILADITRRLRDEPPFSTDPPAPLPASPTAAVEAPLRR